MFTGVILMFLHTLLATPIHIKINLLQHFFLDSWNLNKLNVHLNNLSGEQTQDGYAVGDLSGKVGYSNEKKWDVFFPLRGKHSVAHRSLVIYRWEMFT